MREDNAQLSDAKKEQIKLRATFLNNVGIGVVLIGVFTPIIRAMECGSKEAQQMTLEQAILILMPFVGLAVVAAVIWWQNERDLAPIRKARDAKKK
ncbi:hypothetical protein AXG93_2080s1000 [Marchantia polymorpha subsp. ruderalis]|uniref:Uncharacterized protein n=1 Tax=Marchantia polymorpha subsp. ruderalis TaxID=1480154 RepID=A0A176VT19_MARPO|nr:hypothetical protein AXG93_2080s1000 [Marchantia polymorpha subsp. ruderalis]